jgi:alpha-L-rhamnosidase
LYRDAVGLHETSAGFKTMAIKPHPGADFTQMRAEQMTPYGRAAAEWRKQGEEFILDVVIPVNTTAEVYVPSSSQGAVMLDGVAADLSQHVKVKGYEDGYTLLEVGSGHYTFTAK